MAFVQMSQCFKPSFSIIPMNSLKRVILRDFSLALRCRRAIGLFSTKIQSSSAGESSGEVFVDIDAFLKAAKEESEDLVFDIRPEDVDQLEEKYTEDPFASTEGKDIAASSESRVLNVLPSSDDMKKVLSAYHDSDPVMGELSVEDLKQLLESDSPPFLLDVRTADEFAEARVPEAVNVPLPEVVSSFSNGSVDLDGRQLAIICRSGRRSAQAASELISNFRLRNVYNVTGGTLAWIQQGYEVHSDK